MNLVCFHIGICVDFVKMVLFAGKSKSVEEGGTNMRKTLQQMVRCQDNQGNIPTTTTNHTTKKLLKIKRTTKFFLSNLSSLTDMQKAAVRELGFGALLDYYKVGSVPTTLAFWLLENFDHLRCTLKLPTGDEILIEDKDVELVLGFPRGEIEFNRSDRMTGINYLKNVPFEEEVDILYTTTKVLEKVLKKDAEGGVWFRKIFLMLMETALIETSACGYVKPRIVEVIDDLANIKTYNWCQYLLDNLTRTHKLWSKNKSKVFSGPIVFLVVCFFGLLKFY